MLTAERIIEEIYHLPIVEREKVALHIVKYGIKSSPREAPELLDLEEWQDEIARKPFNLKQASEYLGISPVTLRRWIKAGRVSAYKTGRAYSFDVRDLKKFKRANITSETQ